MIDQLSKWLIRTNSEFHDLILIDGWLRFYYTQNPGMAMGIDMIPTIAVSTIAILATIGIGAYVVFHLDKSTTGYVIAMGLVLGGAIGNIIDRIFMGIVEGYGTILEGHVVDFIYFYLKIGDKTIFPYIFNVADIAISVSLVTLIVFNKKLLPHKETSKISEEENTLEADVPASKEGQSPE